MSEDIGINNLMKRFLLFLSILFLMTGCCLNPTHKSSGVRVGASSSSQLAVQTGKSVKNFLDKTEKDIESNIKSGEKVKTQLTDLEKTLILQAEEQTVDLSLIKEKVNTVVESYEYQFSDLVRLFEDYKKTSNETYLNMEQALIILRTENNMLIKEVNSTNDALTSTVIENEKLHKKIAETTKTASMWRLFVGIISVAILFYILVVTYIPSFFTTIFKWIAGKKGGA